MGDPRKAAADIRLAISVLRDVAQALDIGLWDRCGCGHPKIDHRPIREAQASRGRQYCMRPGCACVDFGA